jgi:hypothetical protein
MSSSRTILYLCLLCLTCLLGSSGCGGKKQVKVEKTSDHSFSVSSSRNPRFDPTVDVVDEIVVEYLNGRRLTFKRDRKWAEGGDAKASGVFNQAHYNIQDQEGRHLILGVAQMWGSTNVEISDHNPDLQQILPGTSPEAVKILEDVFQLCLSRREQFETRPPRQPDRPILGKDQPAPK